MSEVQPQSQSIVDLETAYDLKLKVMRDIRERFEHRALIDRVIKMAENSETHDFSAIFSKISKYIKDKSNSVRSNPKFTDDFEDLLGFFTNFLDAQKEIDNELRTTETVESSSFGM